jgi:hypothetical protein
MTRPARQIGGPLSQSSRVWRFTPRTPGGGTSRPAAVTARATHRPMCPAKAITADGATTQAHTRQRLRKAARHELVPATAATKRGPDEHRSPAARRRNRLDARTLSHNGRSAVDRPRLRARRGRFPNRRRAATHQRPRVAPAPDGMNAARILGAPRRTDRRECYHWLPAAPRPTVTRWRCKLPSGTCLRPPMIICGWFNLL